MVPVALPLDTGANFVDNVAVCDGFRVTGAVIPLELKPVPVVDTLLICTAAFPVFVSVIFCEV
jgi:hypothetical protein